MWWDAQHGGLIQPSQQEGTAVGAESQGLQGVLLDAYCRGINYHRARNITPCLSCSQPLSGPEFDLQNHQEIP